MKTVLTAAPVTVLMTSLIAVPVTALITGLVNCINWRKNDKKKHEAYGCFSRYVHDVLPVGLRFF
jgi:hypothetical protein